MSNNCNKNEDVRISLTFVLKEIARCLLLCYNALSSKACPVETNLGKLIRSLRFRNIKSAIKTIRKNNILGGVCSRVWPRANYF